MTSVAEQACVVAPCGITKSMDFTEFDDHMFAEWRALLEQRIGLYIAPDRKSFLMAGLRTRMREKGFERFRGYYELLREGVSQAEEWSFLIDLLTVHETSFFRHRSSMKLVSDCVLPEAMERSDSFNAWSVGCATGEEAYSLAMLLDEHCLQSGGRFLFGVTGTDISLPALKHARSGIYLCKRLTNIKKRFRERYCKSTSNRYFKIDERLRRRVCFAHLNLRDIGQSPFSDLDLIYCQNLMIYLDRDRRFHIANSLAERLRPGGVLILGPGELLHWKNPCMERMRYDDTLAYRRVKSELLTQFERN